MTNLNRTYEPIKVRDLTDSFISGLKKDRPFELKEIVSGVQVTLACKLHLCLYYGGKAGGTAGLRGKSRLLEKHAGSIKAKLASTRDLRESIAQLMKTTPAESDATEMTSAAIVDEGPSEANDGIAVEGDELIFVGGDEAGVGGQEYWTPMVFAMVAANKAQQTQLDNEPLICDSKELDRAQRVTAAKRVMEICPEWAVRVISPAEYNDRAPTTEWHDFHIDAYLDCLRLLKVRPGADVRVDNFRPRAEKMARLTKRVSHDFRAKLTMLKESECTVIAAASCIASAIRDSAVPRLRGELELLGAGRFDPARAFKERSHESFAKSEVRKFYEDRFGTIFLRERARVEKPMKS